MRAFQVVEWGFLLLFAATARSISLSEPTVNIRQGTVKGVKLYTESGTTVNAFLGIPYASPPVGNLRFAAPELDRGWGRDEAFHAKTFGPACLQPIHELEPTYGADIKQDENCLFLNVWTTDIAMRYGKTPVVLFLEGEGFVSGYPGRFPGQDLAAQGLVLVSASYRLNVFGFLCLEDTDARGNVGLLDQYLVFVWLRENIAAFGGDPTRLTLMGHSAGAASILYHMVSPRTNGLFQGAILMSGSITSPWTKPSAKRSNASFAIAKSLGCHYASTDRILSCLRTHPPQGLLKAFETQYRNGNWSEIPLPVVDDFLPEIEQYLPQDPLTVLRDGNFLRIPILTGVTSHEGAVAMSQWSDLIQEGYEELRRFFSTTLIPSVMRKYNVTDEGSSSLKELLQWHYIRSANQGDTPRLAANLLDFYSDAQFLGPHVTQLEQLARSSHKSSSSEPNAPPIYAYYFQQQGFNLYRNDLNVTGSSHGSELVYLFGPSLMQRAGVPVRRFSPVQDKLSITLKRLWTEFITKGNISATPYGYGTSWTRYSPSEDNYVVFTSDESLPASQPVIREQHKGCPGLPGPGPNKGTTMKRWIGVGLWADLVPSVARKQRGNNTGAQNNTPQHPTGMQLTKDLPYRNAMYTLIGFVVVLLGLLVVCVVLLKRQSVEREREVF